MSNKWNSICKMRRIYKNVSGYHYPDTRSVIAPVRVRENRTGNIEFSTEKYEPMKELGKAFEFQGRSFVIDSTHYNRCATFRLLEVTDYGCTRELYNADELSELHQQYCDLLYENRITEADGKDYQLSTVYEVGYDYATVCRDKLLFWCTGFIYHMGKKTILEPVCYLLEYDGHSFKKHPIRVKGFLFGVNSLVMQGEHLYIGCNQQVVMYNLKYHLYDIFTDISEEDERLLIENHNQEIVKHVNYSIGRRDSLQRACA